MVFFYLKMTFLEPNGLYSLRWPCLSFSPIAVIYFYCVRFRTFTSVLFIISRCKQVPVTDYAAVLRHFCCAKCFSILHFYSASYLSPPIPNCLLCEFSRCLLLKHFMTKSLKIKHKNMTLKESFSVENLKNGFLGNR